METSTDNGVVSPPVPQLRANHQVRFGARDNQVLRLDVAEALLTRWAEKAPKQFGEYLAAVLLGEEALDGRKRSA